MERHRRADHGALQRDFARCLVHGHQIRSMFEHQFGNLICQRLFHALVGNEKIRYGRYRNIQIHARIGTLRDRTDEVQGTVLRHHLGDCIAVGHEVNLNSGSGGQIQE